MDLVKKQYVNSIAWTSIEAFFFQGLLLIHQYILFTVITKDFYGQIGTIFGGIYFLVKVIDLGFNKSLLITYKQYTQDKITFYLFIKKQLKPTVFLYTALILLLLGIKYFFYVKIPFLLTIDFSLLTIIIGSIGAESIKGNLKKILQLSYKFRQVAFFEILFMVCYQIIIWSYYYCTSSLTLFYIFSTLFLLSILEIIGLSIITYKWYGNLPEKNSSNTILPCNSLITKNRALFFGNTMSKQIFSANILVPSFAYSFGLEYAALLKMASYVTHSITSIVERILDPTSFALFGQIEQGNINKTKEAFAVTSHISFHILLCTFIFIIINCTKLLSTSFTAVHMLPFVIIYFLIHYIENFFIIIEKVYIKNNRAEIIFISNLCNSFCAIFFLWLSLSPLFTLSLLLIIRILTFFFLLLPLSLLWNIRMQFMLSSRYVMGSLIASLIFFIIF